MQLQDNFAAYRSLKLTRDADGVLVVEFHSRGSVQIHSTRSYGVCRCLLPDRPRSREQDCDSDGSRRGVHSRNRFLILRRRRRSWCLEPDSRRRRSAARKYSHCTRTSRRGYRGTSPCALRVCVAGQHDCHRRGCDLPRCPALRANHCAGRRNLYRWRYRAGAGRAETFLLNPQPLTAQTAHEWGVVAEVVPNGTALPRARELAKLYLKAPEVTRRNTRVHFIQPLKERIVREVGYGLSLEGASAADLVKSMRAQNEPVAQKGKVA